MDIGIVGIGNMGMGIALRLLDGGHAVTVRDLRPEREALAAAQGATAAPNAAASARRRQQRMSCCRRRRAYRVQWLPDAHWAKRSRMAAAEGEP